MDIGRYSFQPDPEIEFYKQEKTNILNTIFCSILKEKDFLHLIKHYLLFA